MKGRKAMLVLAVAVSLAGAGAAQAGCMATVGLSPLPNEVDAGQPWVVDLTVLQHGRTPLPDATPSVVVAGNATGEATTYPAELVDANAGRYRAEVVFPSSGSWSVAAYDGFPVAECARTHTFGSFSIGAPATPAGGEGGPGASSFPVWPVVGGIAGAAAFLATGLAFGRARARRIA